MIASLFKYVHVQIYEATSVGPLVEKEEKHLLFNLLSERSMHIAYCIRPFYCVMNKAWPPRPVDRCLFHAGPNFSTVSVT